MRKWLRVTVAAVVTASAVCCGMFGLAAFGPEHRNAIWEPVFGIGYFVAGFILHPFTLNRTIGIIGGLIWPLFVTVGVGWLTWRITSGPRRVRAWSAVFYILSLCCWVSSAAADYLSLHWIPFFSNLAGANY